ncbi:MAG: putative quinol monooxygenase [Microcystaceae cyanobacterium]
MTKHNPFVVLLLLTLFYLSIFLVSDIGIIGTKKKVVNAVDAPIPVTTIAKVQVKAAKKRAFLAATDQLVNQSRQEKGVSFFSLYQSVENQQKFLFYEIFVSKIALETHRYARHTQDWFAQVKYYLDGNPEIHNYQEILKNQE